MATIKYLIQSTSDTAGIYVRLREGRILDIKAKTTFLISSKDWSNSKGQPRNLKDEQQKSLNGKLVRFKADLLNHYNNTPNKFEITTQWLKDFINPVQKASETPEKLVEYYDYYAMHKNSSIGYTTKKKLRVQKNLIIKFQKETKVEYLIRDVGPAFRLKLEEFCLSQNYSRNTISQVIKSIKTICYHAQENGIIINQQLKSLRVKWEKADKTYLSFKELNMIEKAKLATDNLNTARDWLLISCETGQRVSDFMRFTKAMIRIEEGKQLIEFTQVKTGKRMTVPLSKRVQAILKKSKGEFPKRLSDQKYNLFIKEVCRQSGLREKVKGSIKNPENERKQSGIFEKWRLVTSHIGRRSFATNYYGRIPTALLIAATGHSTEKMFLEYIGKSDSERAIQLAEYF